MFNSDSCESNYEQMLGMSFKLYYIYARTTIFLWQLFASCFLVILSKIARFVIQHAAYVGRRNFFISCTSNFCRVLFWTVFVSFKKVFDVLTKQDEVFDVVARPVIDKLVALALLYFVAYNSYFYCAEAIKWHFGVLNFSFGYSSK